MNDSTTTENALPPIDRSWRTWAGALGGRVSTMMLRHAGEQLTGDLAPRAVHSSFLAPVSDRPLLVRSEVVRQSRTSAVVRSTLVQHERPVALATALFGTAGDKPTLQAPAAPVVPAPEDCPDAGFPARMFPYTGHFETRMAGEERPFGGGTNPEMTAWIRLREPDLTPAGAALVLLDAMPPAVYAATSELVSVPTAEYSVHFADGLSFAGSGDWALVRVNTDQASDSWAVESSSMWSADGTLLAVGRQTRQILRPAAPGGAVQVPPTWWTGAGA
ncbi:MULTISPECIES: thioesterase family protein [unclassified Kitasatospora]|uniref:thioesterase family protein n=1 Tax=unclassified Kitasatospora TaxID=2633591 RepID=UPI001AE09EBB|nr:thioesterase family protein [Kitasatospora sp. RG8]MBP0450809.1 thioesterase family protein [Kitasatospora sp. RG8]